MQKKKASPPSKKNNISKTQKVNTKLFSTIQVSSKGKVQSGQEDLLNKSHVSKNSEDFDEDEYEESKGLGGQGTNDFASNTSLPQPNIIITQGNDINNNPNFNINNISAID